VSLFEVDPLPRLEALAQQAAALHRTYSAAPLFGVALPPASYGTHSPTSAAAAAGGGGDGDAGDAGDGSSWAAVAARAEAAFSVRDGAFADSAASAGAEAAGSLDPAAYFADPCKAQVPEDRTEKWGTWCRERGAGKGGGGG
jgi:hypothetical protein